MWAPPDRHAFCTRAGEHNRGEVSSRAADVHEVTCAPCTNLSVWIAVVIPPGASEATCARGFAAMPRAKASRWLRRLEPRDRVKRLIEWISLLKRLWTEDQVTFEGDHYRCHGITIEPKPAARPRPPIWIASNAGRGVQMTNPTTDRALVGLQATGGAPR